MTDINITNNLLNNIFDKLTSNNDESNDLLLEYGLKRDNVIKQNDNDKINENEITNTFINSLQAYKSDFKSDLKVPVENNNNKTNNFKFINNYKLIDLSKYFQDNYNIKITQNNSIISHDILDIIVSILVPESITFSNSILLKYIGKLRYTLAYDLDSRMFYYNYKYKKFFNKSDGQAKIINNKHNNKIWFIRYISDYFKINILLVIQLLVIKINPYNNYPTIILGITPRNSLQLYNNNNNSIHTASFGKDFISKMEYSILGWNKIQHYKVDELKKIFNALQIQTDKKLTKAVLYEYINNILGNL